MIARLRRRLQVLASLGFVVLAVGCPAHLGPTRVEGFRISTRSDDGDAQRRASQRYVLEGLDFDAAFAPQKALPRYELALQVDATNPYAYLALARHYAEQGRAAESLRFLARAEAILEAEGSKDAGVQVHLVGLRGWCAHAQGRFERAQRLLREAGHAAPEIWGDGRLSAAELR